MRFEQYERRMDDVEGRVESYDLGQPKGLEHEFASLEAEEAVNRELAEKMIKKLVRRMEIQKIYGDHFIGPIPPEI